MRISFLIVFGFFTGGVVLLVNFHGHIVQRRHVICWRGKVKVYPDGSKEFVEIGAGDLVEFPKGMSCTWEVSVAVDKHYIFD